jgi:murein L,D-transpeptidase YcbB/YkuD
LPEAIACGARRWRAALTLVAIAVMLAATTARAQDPPPRHWDRQTAQSLVAYIERVASHGLDPADYAPAELERAIASGDAARLERQATESFANLAEDLAIGRVKPGRRGRYYIPSDTIDPARVARLIDLAIGWSSAARVLDALAPRNREYAALRTALGQLGPGQGEERRKIAVSLERWRWLPRELGARHLLVNIPEYHVHLVDADRRTSSHRIIVGKRGTPTPQFSATVNAVILNPSWYVPQSIVGESVGSLVRNNPATARARGYTWSYSGGGLRVTQRPGPQNALGQMKLDMPNPFTVYLHDTPNKDLFDEEQRTFSHGCVRTDNPFGLATRLLTPSGWDRAMIDSIVANGETRRVPLQTPIPIYIVYFTAIADPEDGVRYLEDPYNLDAATAAQMKARR